MDHSIDSLINLVKDDFYPKTLIYSNENVNIIPFTHREMKKFYKIKELSKDEKGEISRVKLLKITRDFLIGKIRNENGEYININEIHYFDFIDIMFFIKGISASTVTQKIFSCPECSSKETVDFNLDDIKLVNVENKNLFNELVFDGNVLEKKILSFRLKEYNIRNYLEYLMELEKIMTGDDNYDDEELEKFKLAFFIDTIEIIEENNIDNSFNLSNIPLSKKFEFLSNLSTKKFDVVLETLLNRTYILYTKNIKCSKCNKDYKYGIINDEFESFFF